METARQLREISIHALRGEGDRWLCIRAMPSLDFYPRPPRGGRPGDPGWYGESCCLFLSTPSAGRATRESLSLTSGSFYFYPRPPRGGRQAPPGQAQHKATNFYPRPPRGGRRAVALVACHIHCISIHALRGEGDAVIRRLFSIASNFYPRPPRGGRLPIRAMPLLVVIISIHALRGEGDMT